MTLQDLEKTLLDQAQKQADHILAQAKAEKEKHVLFNQEQRQELAQKMLHAAQEEAQKQAQNILVPARLQAKKIILEKKQELLNSLYSEIQNEHKLEGADLEHLREKSEIKAAQILYG